MRHVALPFVCSLLTLAVLGVSPIAHAELETNTVPDPNAAMANEAAINAAIMSETLAPPAEPVAPAPTVAPAPETLPAFKLQRAGSAAYAAAPNLLQDMLEQSKREKKGLTFYLNGQTVGGVVLKIHGQEWVELRNQQFQRVLVRLPQVDAVAW